MSKSELVGFDNIAYFDSVLERELFIANIAEVTDVSVIKLDAVTLDDIPMYPIHLTFGSGELELEIVDEEKAAIHALPF